MLVIPAPSYSLAQAAWIPRFTIWCDDGTTERREGEPCESWVAAMAASWLKPLGPRHPHKDLTDGRNGVRVCAMPPGSPPVKSIQGPWASQQHRGQPVTREGDRTMKKLLLLLLLFAAMGGSIAPSLSSLLGFAPTVAHAG